jgi:ankyrin repeat protein
MFQSGETALMCAAHGDHPHTVSELLSSGADPTIKNNNNLTAYDIAIDQQSLRCELSMMTAIQHGRTDYYKVAINKVENNSLTGIKSWHMYVNVLQL